MKTEGDDIDFINPDHWSKTTLRRPLIVRVGHYYRDKTPLIGKVADINIWDRSSSHSFLVFKCALSQASHP